VRHTDSTSERLSGVVRSSHGRARTGVAVTLLVALAAAAWLTVFVPRAAAHALLTRAVPAIDGTVARSPGQILLTFSEPVDPTLSLVQIVDAHGRPAPGVSRSQAVPGDQQALRIVLAATLPHGVYTVDWRTVSALDGHVAGGAYAFGVGIADVGAVAPFGKFVSTSLWLTAVAVAGRWALYAGLAILLGAAGVGLLALGGRLPGAAGALLRFGWLLAAVGVATVTLSERAIVRAPSLLPLFETHEGQLLLGQCVAVIVVCGIAMVAAGLVPHPSTLALLGAAAAVAVFTLAWASHANGASPWRALNLADQWLHVIAVGVWIGGLPWLLLGARGLDGPARVAVVRRFSLLATVALVVVLLTGAGRAVSEVGSPSNLVHTSFGIALLVKLGFVGALVALGALNHFAVVPALSGDRPSLRALRRTVSGEIVLGAAVLAVTGLLGGLAPATNAAAAARATASRQVVLSGADYATTVRVRLTLTPGTVGRNTFTAVLRDYASGKPLTGVTSVDLEFSLPSQTAVQASTLALTRSTGVANATWQGSALAPSVEGRWSIAVTVQQETSAVVVPLTLQARLARGP
jgi:copper transport protein